MTLLSLTELGVTIGAPLFSGLTLSLGAGDRLGLVAANGRGKSTLLRLIEGRAEPTEGSVVRAGPTSSTGCATSASTRAVRSATTDN